VAEQIMSESDAGTGIDEVYNDYINKMRELDQINNLERQQ
jgi:hypothetical protein